MHTVEKVRCNRKQQRLLFLTGSQNFWKSELFSNSNVNNNYGWIYVPEEWTRPNLRNRNAGDGEWRKKNVDEANTI